MVICIYAVFSSPLFSLVLVSFSKARYFGILVRLLKGGGKEETGEKKMREKGFPLGDGSWK